MMPLSKKKLRVRMMWDTKWVQWRMDASADYQPRQEGVQ
jgi:hypothetical protein